MSPPPAPRSARARARPRARSSEDGYVMVTAIAILLVTLLLGSAAMSAGVQSLNLAGRGRNDTQALQAADAAANTGWNRINLMQIDSMNLSQSTPCLSWDSSGNVTAVASVLVGGATWCPSVSLAVPGTSSASFQYSVLSSGQRSVVGTATVGSTTRRVKLVVKQSGTSASLFGGYAIESHSSLDFVNQTLVSGAGIRTDGTVKLEDTAVPCHVTTGPITYGVGQSPGYSTTNNAGMCNITPAAESAAISFPSVTVPGSNDDSRICVTSQDPCNGTVTWTSGTQSLNLQNTGDSVTLTGNTYVFCNLTMYNGTLNVKPANGKAVAIYFPAPGSGGCSQNATGSTVLQVQNNTSYINNQTGLGASGLQIYMAGNNNAYINNQSSTQINGVIYAPSGTVQMINNASVKGAVAANTVTMTASSQITYDSTAGNVTGASGNVLYGEQAYTECTASAGSGNPPDNGC